MAPPVKGIYMNIEHRLAQAIRHVLTVSTDDAYRQWASSWLSGEDRHAATAIAARAMLPPGTIEECVVACAILVAMVAPPYAGEQWQTAMELTEEMVDVVVEAATLIQRYQ